MRVERSQASRKNREVIVYKDLGRIEPRDGAERLVCRCRIDCSRTRGPSLEIPVKTKAHGIDQVRGEGVGLRNRRKGAILGSVDDFIVVFIGRAGNGFVAIERPAETILV